VNIEADGVGVDGRGSHLMPPLNMSPVDGTLLGGPGDGDVENGADGLTDEMAIGGRFDNVTKHLVYLMLYRNLSKSSWVIQSH
jgi:hypothetical protein